MIFLRTAIWNLIQQRRFLTYEREEYAKEMLAFAMPIKVNNRNLQAKIWAVKPDAPGAELVHPGINRVTERDLRRDYSSFTIRISAQEI